MEQNCFCFSYVLKHPCFHLFSWRTNFHSCFSLHMYCSCGAVCYFWKSIFRLRPLSSRLPQGYDERTHFWLWWCRFSSSTLCNLQDCMFSQCLFLLPRSRELVSMPIAVFVRNYFFSVRIRQLKLYAFDDPHRFTFESSVVTISDLWFSTLNKKHFTCLEFPHSVFVDDFQMVLLFQYDALLFLFDTRVSLFDLLW